MRIEVDISAANEPDAYRWLDRILHKIEDGWHVWDTVGDPEPEEMMATAWVRDNGRQGERVREMLIASIRRDAWSSTLHGRRVRVTMRPDGPDELNPEHATRLAEEPLVVLVENRNSDGAFLIRVVKELDKSLHRYWLRSGTPVRLDSVGGKGEMPDEIEHRSAQFPFRARLVAIIDSDRKGPNDNESRTARKLQRKCNKWNVPCWVLAKREAENYLPRILLNDRKEAGLDHARQVEAWDRLNDVQKNFFDMKNGLPTAPCAIENELFDRVSQADRELLTNGFGNGVYSCWTIWNVQAKSELLARGQGDLERGIDLIRGEV